MALTVGRATELLAKCREDIAVAMQSTLETQAELHRLLGITGELYEGIAKTEAPEVTVRVIPEERAS